jgi:hypothetical protein
MKDEEFELQPIAAAVDQVSTEDEEEEREGGVERSACVPMASSTRLHRLRRSTAPSWASAADMRDLYAVPDTSDEEGEQEGEDVREYEAPLHPEQLAQAQPALPMLKANPLSYLSYWWVTDLMYTGYKRTLECTDLWQLAPDGRCAL